MDTPVSEKEVKARLEDISKELRDAFFEHNRAQFEGIYKELLIYGRAIRRMRLNDKGDVVIEKVAETGWK